MAGWIRKSLKNGLFILGTAFGAFTGTAAFKTYEHDEQTATITYGQLQDIVGNENPVITNLDISLLRGKRDFEDFVTIALGDEVDFSRQPPRHPALFDRTLRDQVELHYDAQRQEECTNDLCYPPPETVEDMIALAAYITESNLRYDRQAHFIRHTEQAFDNENVLRGLVEFVARAAEVGIEHAYISSMAPDEILTYGKGTCKQYAEAFNATLRRLNAMFGSPYDLSVGTIASIPDDSNDAFYGGLSRLLNLYYFNRNSGNVPHISTIIIDHDPYRLEHPRIYFVDSQLIDPFIDEDQLISVDRELFARYDAALTLAEDYSVRAYAQNHDFNPNGALWDHIVIDDASQRMLIDHLGVREDVVRYVRNHTNPTILTLSEIAAFRRYQGRADMEEIIAYFDDSGWLVSRLLDHHRQEARAQETHAGDLLQCPDSSAGMLEDAGILMPLDRR